MYVYGHHVGTVDSMGWFPTDVVQRLPRERTAAIPYSDNSTEDSCSPLK